MSLPLGHRRLIRQQVQARWAAAWAAPEGIPVLWQGNDATPAPDPSQARHFLELEMDFGSERTMAFGAGRGGAEKGRLGAVIIRVMAGVGEGEDLALDLLDAAEGVFRSYREGPLSFIGSISDFDRGDSEDGNWRHHASLAAWEYRFRG